MDPWETSQFKTPGSERLFSRLRKILVFQVRFKPSNTLW